MANQEIREAAVKAIGKIGGAQAVAYLIGLAQDKKGRLAPVAVETLALLDSVQSLLSFLFLVATVFQFVGFYITINIVIYYSGFSPKIWLVFALNILCVVAGAIIFNFFARGIANAIDSSGYEKDYSHEWRLKGTNIRYKDATVRDVYEHTHGYGSWIKMIEQYRRTLSAFAFILSFALPFFGTYYLRLLDFSSAAFIVNAVFVLLFGIPAWIIANKKLNG